MPVPKTERKFPKGFGASDLVSFYAFSESEAVALLGIQLSSTVEAQPLTFLVFVLENELDDQVALIRWEIKKLGNDEPVKTEESPNTRWDITEGLPRGDYFVSVHLLGAEKTDLGKEHSAAFHQKVKAKDGYLEILLEKSVAIKDKDGSLEKAVFDHSLMGNREASRAFFYDFYPQMVEMFYGIKAEERLDILPLLNSILYLNLLSLKAGASAPWTEEALALSEEVNARGDTEKKIGLAQLTLKQAATLYPDLENRDLFNLLRFPKSSFKLLHQYLASLASNSLNADNQNHLAELASAYRSGDVGLIVPTVDGEHTLYFGKKANGFLKTRGFIEIVKAPLYIHGRVVDFEGNPVPDVRVDYYEIEGVEVIKDQLLFKPELQKFKGKQAWEARLAKGVLCELLETRRKPKGAWFAKVRVPVHGETKTGWICTHLGNFEQQARQRIKKEINATHSDSNGYFGIPLSTHNRLYKLRFVKAGFWDQEIDWSREPRLDMQIKMEQPVAENVRWMKEEDFLPWLKKYVGYVYGNANYPFDLPNAGISKKLIKKDPKPGDVLTVGCNSFTEGLLVKSWQQFHENLVINLAQHLRWMVNPGKASSPKITRETRMLCLKPVEVLKMGERIYEKEVKKPIYQSERNYNLNAGWVLVQYFNNDISSKNLKTWGDGHNVLILGEKDGAYLSLEASSQNHTIRSKEKDGPMFKGVDHIDGLKDEVPPFDPGSNWIRYGKLRKKLGKYQVMYRLFIYDLQLGRPLEY